MTDKTTDESRRGFLKMAATAPVAAAATAAGTEAATAEAAPGSALPDTEHTRTYYASARF